MEKYVFQWRNPQMAPNTKTASLKHIFLHRIEIFFLKKNIQSAVKAQYLYVSVFERKKNSNANGAILSITPSDGN